MSLDMSKPIATRDGRAAIIESRDGGFTMGGYRYPIEARVEHPNEPGAWVRHPYMVDGRYKSNDQTNHNDLVNIRAH